jgi:hypothetical protein
MGVKSLAIFCGLLLGSMTSPIALAVGTEATLERQVWPKKRSCEQCVPLQFGVLQVQLPLAQVGSILLLGSDLGGVNIFPKNGDRAASVLLGSIQHENLVGLFETSGLLNRRESISNEAFFDRLGTPAETSSSFDKLRRINGVAHAKLYLKASRGGIHAYSIMADPPVAESVYFVIDGDTTVYSLMGKVTPQMFEMILSNMKVAPIP